MILILTVARHPKDMRASIEHDSERLRRLADFDLAEKLSVCKVGKSDSRQTFPKSWLVVGGCMWSLYFARLEMYSLYPLLVGANRNKREIL